MSGLLAFGLIAGIILVFDLAVTAFGVDSRPDFGTDRPAGLA